MVEESMGMVEAVHSLGRAGLSLRLINAARSCGHQFTARGSTIRMPNFFRRHQKVLLHVAFWLMYASYFFYAISFGKRGDLEWARIVPDFLFHIIMLLIVSYLNYFYFLPRLIRDRNVTRFLLSFLPVFMGLSYLLLLGKRYLIIGFVDGKDGWAYSTRFALSVFMAVFFVTAFVGLLRFIEDYFELENRQLTSELRFLKAQVNPHFLFNTLNNLYFLAVNQSDRTPEVVAKLSGMMRYMIHESNEEKVPLSREVEYMENYLDLEKLRLNEEVPIIFEVHGEISGVRITPLILITFLENAFKHGIGNTNGDSWITVSLKIEAGTLHYKVANSIVRQTEKTVREASGIGLTNARRRLQLSYPGKHDLSVTEDDERYRVHLTIDLQ